MKKGMLLLMLLFSVFANAQSLKDALYSGKLKTDSGTVIRKGDDLSSKIDTSKKKPVEVKEIKNSTAVRDSSMTAMPGDSVTTTGTSTATKDNSTVIENSGVKDNNKVWKEFTDSLVSSLKSEALPSKKIKSGTYYLLVEYEIGVDGQLAVNSVSCSPESSFLEQQVKERFTLAAPQLNPVLASNGKPRKSVKKYSFTLTKP